MNKIIRKIANQNKISKKTIEEAFERSGFTVDIEFNRGEEAFLNHYVVKCNEKTYHFLNRKVSYFNDRHSTSTLRQLSILSDIGFVSPLHIGVGDFSNILYRAKYSPDVRMHVENYMVEDFSINLASAYFNKHIKVSYSFSTYLVIIHEAIRAYFSGLNSVAVLSIYPVIEGALRNLQCKFGSQSESNTSAKAFDKSFRHMIIDIGRNSLGASDWHPGYNTYNEEELSFFTHLFPYCDLINSFRIFVKDVLYMPTGNLKSEFSVNRHMVVHMLNGFSIQKSDFIRLFYCMVHVAFAEAMFDNKVPMFWRGIYDEDVQEFSDFRP